MSEDTCAIASEYIYLHNSNIKICDALCPCENKCLNEHAHKRILVSSSYSSIKPWYYTIVIKLRSLTYER